MFLTRVAPSNPFNILRKNFHKAQLMFTIFKLLLTITTAGEGKKPYREVIPVADYATSNVT